MAGPSEPSPALRAAHAAALLAVVLWGLSFVATKALLTEIAPTTLVFTRFAVGGAALGLFVVLRRTGRDGARVDPRSVALMGFSGIFLHQMLQVFGLQWTSATKTGWLIGIIPIWSALLGALFLAERLGRARGIGLLLGLAGVVLIVGSPVSGSGPASLAIGRGDALVLASTVNWAVYTVLARRFLRRGGGARTTAWAMVTGALLLGVPFLVAGGWREWAAISARGWGALLFLALGCSGLAYLCWSYALERLEASSVAAWLYLEPFVTQAAAASLLVEPLAPTVIAGGIVVLAGVWLVQRRPRRG